ncbi:major facilitator superfamily domain-containing protein [Pelagophyceae sp. CCMP2097]|nr:major facilitator superfamily domain-containing protein [Pelagophyceae sp. CCMP2097]
MRRCAVLLLAAAAAGPEKRPVRGRAAARTFARVEVVEAEPCTAAQLRGGAVSVAPDDWRRGVLSIVGGTVAHLVLGSLYCFGNFLSYMPQHLQYYDGVARAGQPDALSILPLTILTQCLTMPVGAKLAKKIGSQNAVLLGGLTVSLAVLLASFATNLYTFTLFYAVLFGVGTGLAYTAPLVAGWSWFPKQRGAVNGAVLMGFGSGGFIFNKVGSRIANPSNLKPNALSGFPAEVYDNFAPMLRKLALVYALTTCLGAALVQSKPNTAVVAGKDVPPPPAVPPASPLALVKTRRFAVLYALTFLTATAGLTEAALYKVFATTSPIASSTLNDDAYLSNVGATAALANGFSRFFWGLAADAFGFKAPFVAMLAVQALTMLALPGAAAAGRGPYARAVFVSFACLGGTFSLVPTVVGATFGAANAADVYALLFSANVLAAFGGVRAAKMLVPSLGWKPVYKLLSAMSTLALALLALGVQGQPAKRV